MTRRDDSRIIRIVHPICCGLDVYKESVSACVIFPDSNGEEQHEIYVFGTFTDDLRQLRQWLLDHECPVVTMESTGGLLAPDAQCIGRNGSGRKTDIEDSQWIAGLSRHGLLKGSFIPPQAVRQWRDLTRLRKKYVQSATTGNGLTSFLNRQTPRSIQWYRIYSV